MTALDHIVVAIYLLAMLVMGVVLARRQRSTKDFFVAGRSLPAWAVGLSILATMASTITYLGTPGEMFRTGVGFLTRQLAVPLVLVVVWFLWIPYFMRLELTSAYELLERRFNYATRALAASLCLALLFGWMAVVVLTASQAMAEIIGLDVHLLIVVIGLFAALYTTLGGMRAVVWTDVVQFLVLLAGALFTIGYVMWTTDTGLSDWLTAQRAYPHRESVEWYRWDIGDRTNILFVTVGMAFWLISTHGANQVALQRYFAVHDVWAARKSYLISALAGFGLGLLLAAVGLCLIYFTQEHPLPAIDAIHSPSASERHPAQDKVFPQFIRAYLPAGLRGLVVAALFAAAMSTIDSGANSVAAIVTVDFFRRRGGDAVTPEAELRLARRLTATIGLMIIAVAIGLHHASQGTDIISLTQKGFNCFLGPLGALFVLAMFSKRATPVTVIPAVVFGELVGVLTSYSQELFDVAYSTHLVIPGAWLATLITGWLLALALRTETSLEQRRWMWRAVVRSGR